MSIASLIGLLSLTLSLIILWKIRQLLLLLFSAIVIAVILNRLVKQLESYGLRRKLALFLSIFLTSSCIIIFLSLVIAPFIEQFQKLIDLSPIIWQKLRWQIEIWESHLPKFLPSPPGISELLNQLPALDEIFNQILQFFSVSINIFLQFLFVLVLAIMFLSQPEEYRKLLIKLFPSFYRKRANYILIESGSALENWLTGIAINSLFVATLSAIGLSLLQVDLVLTHALLAGILNFIPNIGPAMSVVFPIMIAILEAPWKIFSVIILYFVIQNLESYWFSPMVMAKQVSLLPAMTLLAQIFFTQVFGALGLILALPLTVVFKTWFEAVILEDYLDKMPKNKIK